MTNLIYSQKEQAQMLSRILSFNICCTVIIAQNSRKKSTFKQLYDLIVEFEVPAGTST